MLRSRKVDLAGRLLIGGTEWCRFPQLGLPAVKARIDTGAKTSAIHAFNITPQLKAKKPSVSFDICPIQNNSDLIVHCRAPLVDQRVVVSSNGQKEQRYVIEALMCLGKETWSIELTLSNRDQMRYRLLLGRQALNNRVLIDPGMSCNLGRFKRQQLLQLYNDIS